jgi:hypothetical protein
MLGKTGKENIKSFHVIGNPCLYQFRERPVSCLDKEITFFQEQLLYAS